MNFIHIAKKQSKKALVYKCVIQHFNFYMHEIQAKRHTCGVGEGGAASTGETIVALLAIVYKAIEPSRCCLITALSRSSKSSSKPKEKAVFQKLITNEGKQGFNEDKKT